MKRKIGSIVAIAVLSIAAMGMQPVAGGVLPGDANLDNQLTGEDVVKLKRVLIGLEDPLEGADLDVNRDGKVSGADVVALKRILVEEGTRYLVRIGEADVVFTGTPEKGWARLDLTDKNDDDVFWNSFWYASEIIDTATSLGYNVVKYQQVMAAEIEVHAGCHIAGPLCPEYDRMDEIDIELWTQDWGL